MVWPPTDFTSGGFNTSNFIYTDAGTAWDSCSLSTHGNASRITIAPRNGFDFTIWSARLTITPPVAGRFALSIYGFRKSGPTNDYPNLSNIVLKINDVAVVFTPVTEFESVFWVYAPNYPGLSNGRTDWIFNLGVCEPLTLEWLFTGDPTDRPLDAFDLRYNGAMEISYLGP